MGSLQKIKGKGKDAGKTFYRIQPYVNGKRVTIRFGTGQKQAEVSRTAIADLIDCQQAGSDELNAASKSWLQNTADLAMCELLLS